MTGFCLFTAGKCPFYPGAIALAFLHGLELQPLKTMMAAFIIAVKGTVRQQ